MWYSHCFLETATVINCFSAWNGISKLEINSHWPIFLLNISFEAFQILLGMRGTLGNDGVVVGDSQI